MPPNEDPEHYYNNPELLTQRRNLVVRLRDYSLIGTVVFGGAVILEAFGIIESPSQEVVDAFRVGTAGSALGALTGEFLQRSMGNRLNELQQPPDEPQ